MFDGLLRPKWQHADPRQRQAALESATLPPDVLATIVREDSDEHVRNSAIQRIDDLDLLAELLQTGRDRDAVVQRQCELLAAPLDSPPALDQRLTLMRTSGSAELCANLARRAQTVEIRTAALEQLTDVQVLCAVAVEDPVASVRQLALERITEPEGWEIVSRDTRNKDKQIRRAARERLEAHRQNIANNETAERLCHEMDELLASDSLTSHSQPMFQRLCKQWQAITTPPPQLSDRFSSLQQQLAARIERFETQIRERRSICAEMEALLEQIQQGLRDDTDDANARTQQINSLNERWRSTDPEQHSNHPLTLRYADLQTQISQASEGLQRDRQRMARQRELIDHARTLQQQTEKLDDKKIKQLQQRWQKIDKPTPTELATSLQNEFDDVLRSMRQQLKHRLEQRKKALQEAEELLPDMQQALKDGELEQTLSLRDRINHRLKLAKGIEQQRHDALHKQLNQMRTKLDEMRQWRHWGSDHAREHLLTETEALIGSSLGADEIALRVRNARKAWQRIDHAEGPADEALWQRFDKACTSAYEPYQKQRKHQKDVMNQHLAEKRKLCAELTEFEQNTDWGAVDWREADHYIHKARERWRRIGFVTRKQAKPLEKDFHAILDLLDTHLAPERNRELKRRKALIARVEEIASSSDLRSASREVKDAQNEWKPSVTLPRKEEQALWKQFRKACDAVFDQIREQRNSADEERQANLKRKQAICAQLESLLEQPDTDYREIHKQFDASREEWNQIRNIPRKQERAIDDRYASIKARIAERQRQEAKTAKTARLNAMRARSQLCARLEHALLDQDQARDEASQQALLEQSSHDWEALPAVDPKCTKLFQARYDLASRALRGDEPAQASLRAALADNLAQRLQLCLQLEVAAGVDSPAEYADARMKYQVSLLADTLQHIHPETKKGEDRILELETDWLLAGPVEQTERDQLEQRFKRALSADR